MTIKPKHLQFCMYYLQTNDPGVAYKMTYPKAAIKSLYAAASRLMARPDVATWIAETRDRMQDRLLREIEDTQVQAKKEQLLSMAQKRAVLTGIILGETKRTRHIKTKYGVTKVEDDQPVYALLRAIDLDTRLENFQNYLLHRDSWGKQPTVHINTPTLQQQVNILIAQSQMTGVSETPLLTKEHVPTLRGEEYPQGEGALAEEEHAQNKVPLLNKEGRMDVLSPTEEVHSGEVAPAPDTSLLPPFKGRIKDNSSLEGGAEGGGCTLAEEKVPSPWERAEGEVPAPDTSLQPPFKGRIKDNSSLEGGAGGGGCTPAQEKAPSPWERAGGEAFPFQNRFT